MRDLTYRIWLTLLAVLVCLAPSVLRADLVHLANGKVLQGEVIKEDANYITIRVLQGELRIPMAQVDYIERQTPLDYRLDVGRAQLQQKNYAKAVGILQEAFMANREHAEARRMFGQALVAHARHYLDNSRYREAREIYERVKNLDPSQGLFGDELRRGLAEVARQERAVGELITRARNLERAGDLNGAIENFSQALDNAPDLRTEVGVELARAYSARAMISYRAGQSESAASDLERALKLDPQQGDRLADLYAASALPQILKLLSSGDNEQADARLDRVISFSPNNRAALYVAGRVQEARGRIGDAAELFARALRTRVANPTPEYVTQLRARLERDLGVQDGNWAITPGADAPAAVTAQASSDSQLLETENFSIHHYNSNLASRVADAAEQHRLRVQQELGLPKTWSGKAKVYIHRSQEEYTKKTGQPEWTGGVSRFAQGRTPEIHSWQTSPRLLTSVMPHEIAHLVVSSNLRDFGSLPKCLHEGYAILIEPQFRKEYFLDFLRVRLKSQDFIPLQELLTLREYPKDPEFFYAEGYALLEFLAQNKGRQALSSLITESAPRNTIIADIQSRMGAAGIEQLEEEWKRWILGQKRNSSAADRLARDINDGVTRRIDLNK